MFQLEEISRRLGGRLIGHTPLKGGVSARVEAVELAFEDGRSLRVVLRQPGAADWSTPDLELARREFTLLAWLAARGLPVPRPLLLGDADARSPSPWYVMEHIDGSTEITHLPEALDRAADVLAHLHGLPLADAPPLPEREDPVAGLLEYLPPDHAELRRTLAEDPPKLSLRRSLLHGDYWPGNLLWRGRDLVAVLDWEAAALGDPLSDVACCRLELRYKYGSEASAAFTARYARQRPAGLGELPLWDAYVSAAALMFMGRWGLDPVLLAHMRREAEAALSQAAEALRHGAATRAEGGPRPLGATGE